MNEWYAWDSKNRTAVDGYSRRQQWSIHKWTLKNILIEIKFTYHNFHPSNLMMFSMVTRSCNYYHNLSLKHFRHPCPPQNSVPISSHSLCLYPTKLHTSFCPTKPLIHLSLGRYYATFYTHTHTHTYTLYTYIQYCIYYIICIIR